MPRRSTLAKMPSSAAVNVRSSSAGKIVSRSQRGASSVVVMQAARRKRGRRCDLAAADCGLQPDAGCQARRRPPRGDRAQHFLDLHAGERGADAVVASDPEDQLRLRQPARHVEAIGVLVHVGVAVRGVEVRRHQGARGHRDSEELGVVLVEVLPLPDDRFEARTLFDRALDEAGVSRRRGPTDRGARRATTA